MKFTICLIAVSLLIGNQATAQDNKTKDSEFIKSTIDLGCVVHDIDASMRFYTEALGFKSAGGFKVNAEFATDSGLTNKKPLNVQILTLGEGESATKLKLMQVEGGGAEAANEHIHSTLGFSYITIFVKSTDAAMARLKKAGVKPIAKGPIVLPASLDATMALTVVRDPDGNLIELVGPKPK